MVSQESDTTEMSKDRYVPHLYLLSVLYIKVYMWNLGKWHSWPYFQGRNRDANVEKGHVDTEGKEGGMNWKIRIDIWYGV